MIANPFQPRFRAVRVSNRAEDNGVRPIANSAGDLFTARTALAFAVDRRRRRGYVIQQAGAVTLVWRDKIGGSLVCGFWVEDTSKPLLSDRLGHGNAVESTVVLTKRVSLAKRVTPNVDTLIRSGL